MRLACAWTAIFLTVGCGVDLDSADKGTGTAVSTATGTGSATATSTASGTGTATSTSTDGMVPFTGTIETAAYDAATHSLMVKVGYGGCGKMTLTLAVDVCLESYPAQCSGMLREPAPTGDPVCAAFVVDEQVIALPATLDDSYLTVAGATAPGVRVLVDRDGSLAAMGHGVAPLFYGNVQDLRFDAATNAVSMMLGVQALCDVAHEFLLDLSPDCKDAAKMAATHVCAASLRHVKGANLESCGDDDSLARTFPLAAVATTDAYELEIKVRDDTLKLAVPKK